jgi:hypothetical protein
MWETLSRARHVDEKLTWDGEESENDHFFTPPQSPFKKITIKYPTSFKSE